MQSSGRSMILGCRRLLGRCLCLVEGFQHQVSCYNVETRRRIAHAGETQYLQHSSIVFVQEVERLLSCSHFIQPYLSSGVFFGIEDKISGYEGIMECDLGLYFITVFKSRDLKENELMIRPYYSPKFVAMMQQNSQLEIYHSAFSPHFYHFLQSLLTYLCSNLHGDCLQILQSNKSCSFEITQNLIALPGLRFILATLLNVFISFDWMQLQKQAEKQEKQANMQENKQLNKQESKKHSIVPKKPSNFYLQFRKGKLQIIQRPQLYL